MTPALNTSLMAPAGKRLRVKSITILGELYSAKNSMQITPMRYGPRRFILLKSKRAEQAEKPLMQQLAVYRQHWRSMVEGHTTPLAIRFKIYRQTRRKFDYVNCVQSILDCMVKMEWLVDDDADHVIPVFDHYEVDPKKPRVVISIAGSGSEIVIRKNQPALL